MSTLTQPMSKSMVATSTQAGYYSIPRKALEVPEILITTLRYLTKIDLYRSALVCVRWKAIAIELLWKYYTPQIHQLREMHENSTLEKYIALMRDLRIKCKDSERRDYQGGPCRMVEAHEFIKEIGTTYYPHLEVFALTVNTWFKYASPEYLGGLIQPCLRELTMDAVFGVYSMLGLLNKNAVNLEAMNMKTMTGGSPEDDENFHLFISSHPQLQKITNLLSYISNLTFVSLAKLPSLDTLSICSIKSADWPDFILNSTPDVSPLFPALRSLDLRGTNVADKDGLARLISSGMFAKLEVLKVYFFGTGMIPVLHNCPRLKSVKLRASWEDEDQQEIVHEGLEVEQGEYSKPDYNLELSDLDPLHIFNFFRACHRLFKVTLQFNRFRVVSSADLCHAFTLLPHVRTLDLPWSCSIGEPELRALKSSCPYITSFSMSEETVVI